MRFFVGLVIVLLAIVGGFFVFSREGSVDSGPGTPVESETIVLTEDGFVPNTVTLYYGGTITFKNETGKPYWPASNLHPDHSIYPEFDPKRPLAADEEWSFTFERVGKWNMHDHIRAYFLGTIYVVEE